MVIHPCPLEGLLLIEHQRWEDQRGFFMETYQKQAFAEAGIVAEFVQDNLSFSHAGVLRGLHAQAGDQKQGKLVRVLQGRVWDVAVDIRAGSTTYGQYFHVELSGDQPFSFWIPPGFLHGFLTLEDQTLFTYKVTGFYDPDGEIGVRWDDPTLDIAWPLAGVEPLISEKDAALPYWAQLKSPFQFT